MTINLRVSIPAVVIAVLAATATSQTRVQLLHASDLEGDVDAVDNAPNFAAVVDQLEANAATNRVPSLLLSAGDNYIPGPFFSAAGDFSLRTPLRTALGNPNAREGSGRVDIAIMNIIGFDAAAVGNHEFDNGADTFAGLIGTDIRNLGMANEDPRWLGAQFPYLSANLDFSAEGSLSSLFTSIILPTMAFESPLSNLVAAAAAPKLAPAAIVVRGSEQFGIVGATTPLLASISSTGNVAVRNPGAGTNNMADLAAVLQPTIDELTTQGVNKIILVSHLQQIALEQQLIGLLNDVDIVVAGGSDTLLADPGDYLRPGDVAQGSYPIVTTNGNGQPAAIVSTDGEYRYVGRLVVDFDAAGVLQPASIVQAESGAFATDDTGVINVWGNLTAPFQSGTRGQVVRDLTAAVRTVVIAKDSNIVGSASVFLEGRRTAVRTEETNLGNLTADANLTFAQSVDATVQVSHKNGGGIRAEIGSVNGITGALEPTVANPLSGKLAGQISQLDIENSLRFNNALTLITLTRPQLKEVLEHAVSQTAPGATPGRFGQWSGLSFSFDATQPVGSRVQFAGLTDPSAKSPILVADGAVVGSKPVRIVTLNFLANGGDSYPFPAFETANPSFANRVDLDTLGLPVGAATFAGAGTEQDALAEFLLANFSVSPFSVADTPVAQDDRVQNLGERGEGVVAFVNPSFQICVNQDTTNCGPLTIDVVGALPNTRLLNLVSLQCSSGTGPLFGIGADALWQLSLPFGFEPFQVQSSGFGIYSWTLPTACITPFDVEAISIEFIEFAGLQFFSRVTAPSECAQIAL